MLTLVRSLGAGSEMREFLTLTRERYEYSLQQNEIVNLYGDAYKDGDDDGLDYAEKTDEDITPAQNFPDRGRSVMCIDFQVRTTWAVSTGTCCSGALLSFSVGSPTARARAQHKHTCPG